MNRKAKKRIALAVAISVGALGALTGVLHSSVGRPWLAKIGGCPVGRASAAEIEQARSTAVAATRGVDPAPARPALGFVLEQSTPEDVHAWAARAGVSCKDRREGLFVSCSAAPLAALAGHEGESGLVDDVSFAFRPRDRTLVNVTATSFALASDVAATRMRRSAATLARTLGDPSSAAGDPTPETFARGGYATATVSYRFRDLLADVTATSLSRGVTLREHYVSAND